MFPAGGVVCLALLRLGRACRGVPQAQLVERQFVSLVQDEACAVEILVVVVVTQRDDRWDAGRHAGREPVLRVFHCQAVAWRQAKLAQGGLVQVGRGFFCRSAIAGSDDVEPVVRLRTEVLLDQGNDVLFARARGDGQADALGAGIADQLADIAA